MILVRLVLSPTAMLPIQGITMHIIFAYVLFEISFEFGKFFAMIKTTQIIRDICRSWAR